MNEISSTVTTTSAHDSNSDDSDANKSDSDVNKSDSNVYFKSDDSNSDDEYDHELHERRLLKQTEMARKAKLEEKTPTKPEVYDDDFNKILMEIHENDDIYFDNPVPQSVISPTISSVTA